MFDKRYFYLIEFQYLGFRYHGFQKQPDVKTVQYMLERTFNYVLGHKDFKTLASGRTDAMVSANHGYFELFVKEELEVEEVFKLLNENLPSDIRALSIVKVDEKFNVIQSPKIKEYIYLFSFGEKNHPFAAPFICNISDELNIKVMMEAARKFEGQHNFQNYVYKPSEHTVLERAVDHCEIKVNDIYTANFFPEKSYAFVVRGAGFMRHQVRLMIGTLIELGRQKITIEEFDQSLISKREEPFTFIAPASGLMLNRVDMTK